MRPSGFLMCKLLTDEISFCIENTPSFLIEIVSKIREISLCQTMLLDLIPLRSMPARL